MHKMLTQTVIKVFYHRMATACSLTKEVIAAHAGSWDCRWCPPSTDTKVAMAAQDHLLTITRLFFEQQANQ